MGSSHPQETGGSDYLMVSNDEPGWLRAVVEFESDCVSANSLATPDDH